MDVETINKKCSHENDIKLIDQDKCDVNSTDDELYLKSLEHKIKQCLSRPAIINYNEVYARVSSKIKAGIIPNFVSREDSIHEKIPLIPQKVHINCSINSSSLVKREPKFLPYEPYKACVRFITIEENESKKTIDARNIRFNKRTKYKKNSEEVFSMHTLEEKNFNAGKIISDLKQEIFSLNQILTTQSQVNSDLKKLLVASLGEDVQEKVQCLTEERARMAKMIRKYSEKVDVDYEEKERLSIQGDVWKSKFHASSLLLDELRDTNFTLNNHIKQASEALKMMLEERNVAYPLLLNTYRHMYQVQEAFDPLHSDCAGSESLLSTDSLSLTIATSSLSENVRNRLVGSMGLVTKGVSLPHPTKTPGENVATQALKNCKSLLTENAGLPLTKRSVLSSQFGIDKRLTFNCCSHCNGEVILM